MSSQEKKINGKVAITTKSLHLSEFMPMLESLNKRGDLNEVIKNKVIKSCELLDENIPLYPNGYIKEHDIADITSKYPTHLEEEQKEQDNQPPAQQLSNSLPETVFTCAGRIMALRFFGKAAFFTIKDQSGQIQCYIQLERVGKEVYSNFKKFDIGDIVGVSGSLFRTKTGELTLACQKISLITRAIRSLPEKYHGLKDVEIRYRQRYVDLIVNPKTKEIFRKRSLIVREFRHFMEDQGFLEVETPMMQPIAGGATARPFTTHHNALDMQLYMRVAPELYLKRLVVGGFEKVFEINRNFRNEGVSTQHNPEFTMCEFYWAYATFEDLMSLTEKLFGHIAEKVCGTCQITYQGVPINLGEGVWTRLSFHKSLETIGGHSPDLFMNYDKLAEHLKTRGEKVFFGEKLGKLQAKLFDLDVEHKLIQPHFIYHYPTDISPLSRRNDLNPEITDRFELFISGRELANAFSELNDPMDQRKRFEDQASEKAAGDDEAHAMDEDYLRALEYGMPPAAGEGIGIDRLVMLLTDAASIREVILFPLLKAEY